MFALNTGACLAQAPAQDTKSQETKPGGTNPNPASSGDSKSATLSTSAESATQAASGSGSSSLDPAQAQLLADTEKLVRLSQELKAEVAKSTKDTLSVTVIRKAEEVEALAKSLRERMNKVR